MSPTNMQGDQSATEEMTADQLDQMEQSDRLGGAGTLLGDESIDQVDSMDQNELEARSSMDGRNDTMNDMNSYSGMPTDSAGATDTSSAWSASNGVFGGQAGDVGTDEPEESRVQEALDPNHQGWGMGSGAMAKDPVCGVMVDTTTAQNTLPAPVGSTMDTLYFDSPECKALFEANPDQYIANY